MRRGTRSEMSWMNRITPRIEYLPLERPFFEALKIYGKRLGTFVLTVTALLGLLVLTIAAIRYERLSPLKVNLYVIIAFLGGVAAGILGIYERFREDSWKVSLTFLGQLYILSRGLLPSAVFVIVSATSLLKDQPLLRAVLCGVCSEAFLRSKFYVKRVAKGAGNFEDLVRGPLDALRWYQDQFLTPIEGNLAKSKIQRVETIVSRWNTFTQMHERFEDRIFAWPQAKITELKKAVTTLNAQYSEEVQKIGGRIDPAVDEKFRYRLYYMIFEHLGKDAIEVIFHEDLKNSA
jgi:hypothetical protein